MTRAVGLIESPRTPAELVAIHQRNPRRGVRITPRWSWRYPESFFRLTLSFADAEQFYSDADELVRASSPLFWEPGTAAQVLLWAECSAGHWCLALTRWGVLRWEYCDARARVAAALECRTPLPSMVQPDAPFCVGVSLACQNRGAATVQLLAGPPGAPLTVIAQTACALPIAAVHPATVRVGEGPRRFRPMAARAGELLAVGTAVYQLFQGCWHGATGVRALRINQSALACRIDADTVLAYPAAGFDALANNYWHHLAITDPRVRVVRFPTCNEMSTRFFGSSDHKHWQALPCRLTPGTASADTRCLEALLPPRTGTLHIANAPVYDEARRDADLAEARRIGARIHTVAVSRGGLPVHVVELTDPSVPLRGKRGVVLICGQHSPLEQMTGFLGLPLLRELARAHCAQGPARALLGRLAVYWVPIFNIDAARRGLPGMTLDGANPNRRWFARRGPEQTGVVRFFRQRGRAGLRIGLMLDGHGGGIWRNHTILADYHRSNADVEAATGFGRRRRALRLAPPDRLKARWFELLQCHAGLRELWENGVAPSGPSRAPEWFQSTFGCPAFTLECSVMTHFDPATRRTLPFTLAAYQRLGRDIARAIVAGLPLLEETVVMEQA